jgi:hypothetical protein
VCQHADDHAVRIANEEATDAPRLVHRTVDHLVTGPHRFRVGRVDGAERSTPMLGSAGSTPGGAKRTCAWPEPKPMCRAEGALFETEHPRLETARGLEIR